MEEFSDNIYINKVLQGEVNLFAVLIDRYKNMAYTMAFRIVNNSEDAEEIVQDAFLKVYKNLAGFKNRSKFSTWLYRIVYNTSISKIRTKKQAGEPLDNLHYLSDPSLSALEELEMEEQKKIIHNLLNRLPKDEQTLLTLYYTNENSIEEIGEITGLSNANVKVKLYRARKKLHEWIISTSEFRRQELTTLNFQL
ncbi:MAG: sigma-70 family RNA polymerase sigma factor [Bacteroidales bacterium]|nr:sigma-70 family RNA polymerase sigma factor [Bacteroidales bacterium]